jgi:hypothetical protein
MSGNLDFLKVTLIVSASITILLVLASLMLLLIKNKNHAKRNSPHDTETEGTPAVNDIKPYAPLRHGENGERSASFSYVFYHILIHLSRAFFTFFKKLFQAPPFSSFFSRPTTPPTTHFFLIFQGIFLDF